MSGQKIRKLQQNKKEEGAERKRNRSNFAGVKRVNVKLRDDSSSVSGSINSRGSIKSKGLGGGGVDKKSDISGYGSDRLS